MKHVLSQPVATLRGATLPDGAVVDVELVRDGEHMVVAGVNPAVQTCEIADEDVDLRGYVLMTAAAEPHAHLDKALSWDVLQPPLGSLYDAIANWKQGSADFDEESFRRRAREATLALVRNGTTAVRSHVDILAGNDPLRGVRAVAQVRRDLHHLIDIEIVAMCKAYSSVDLLYSALDAGADLVGGAPHNAPDPLGDLDKLLTAAEVRGVGVDLHTDEFLEGDHHTIAAFADRVTAWPAERNRTAGHCSRLSTMDPSELRELVPRIAASGIGVVANPITNLYLQGRDHPVSMPRAITAIEPLRTGGVLVAAGADNVRDPFNPIGRSDALETAALTIMAAHIHPDAALAMVTDDARAVMGLPVAGARVGARAEFLAVRGTSVLDVIANAPADRIVVHNGVVVSVSETSTWIAPTAP